MRVVSVDARLERVTVYASGARVRRVTELAVPLPPRVRIAGLPLAVIDDTVRVEVTGPAIATSVRTGVDAPAADEAAAEEPPALRAARLREQLAASELERVRNALDQLGRAPVVEVDLSEERSSVPWVDVVAARRAVVALRAERDLALREQLAAARAALDEAQRAAEALADRDRRAGTARAPKLHELRKYIELELSPLTAGGAGAIAIRVEYLVAAARWAPSYVARLDGDRATVELRAVVAQDTGEDWRAVPLALSTAEPARFAVLPELAAQKIGRRQAEPLRGFRPPPAGAEALFADYDRDRERDGRARQPPRTALTEEVWDDPSSRAKDAYETPAAGAPVLARRAPQAERAQTAAGAVRARTTMPMSPVPARPAPPAAAPQSKTMSAPMPAFQSAPEPARFADDGVAPGPPMGGAAAAGSRTESGGLPPELIAQAIAASTPPPPRLDYGNLRMATPEMPWRGRLIPAPPDRHAAVIAHEVAAMQRRIAELALPDGCAAAWLHTYDYAFATDGAVDVRSDGAWHSIAVTGAAATAKLWHVAVPREQADVFRVASITNPFAGPLLPGPIDVYDAGRFLVTSTVEYAPPGAPVEIGLGVDPAVKVARNAEFREEVGGMLRGALKLIHAIAIDIENLSGRPIELEVRERVPVAREGDDDVEIAIARAEPPWERWTPDPEAPRDERLRGGHRWRVAIPPQQKRTLRAGYEIKIAGKHELVGGNRREP